MKQSQQLHIAIVGAGKVGSVLGRILVENGAVITCVVSRSIASARRAGRFLGCRCVSTDLAAIPAATDLIYITTPHGAIAGVARALAEVNHLRFSRLAVCHASGVLTAEVLAPLQARGAAVFSFHPLQTFPRDFLPEEIVPSAHGIYYGVDGSPRAVRTARLLARALGGKIILVPPEFRPLYHAACVVASNHLTAILALLQDMYDRMDIRGADFLAAFKPIITATLENVEKTSPAEALSGPVARGGTETVAQHFQALQQYMPELIPYFARLSLETVRLAERKGSITREQVQALTGVVASFTHTTSDPRKQ